MTKFRTVKQKLNGIPSWIVRSALIAFALVNVSITGYFAAGVLLFSLGVPLVSVGMPDVVGLASGLAMTVLSAYGLTAA